MLKPQELFIGAAIWLKSKNKPYEISDGYDIYKLDEAGELMDADPIPLTPEILTDWCGWKKIGSDFTIKGIFLHNRKRGFVLSKRFKPIQHLHQLQALYQLLTGEVMPINLPKNQ